MPKVVFDNTALEGIHQYIERYTLYFEELYSDTGLWNEDMISYTKLETYIRWKSKILIVAWRDEDGMRIVEKIEVR